MSTQATTAPSTVSSTVDSALLDDGETQRGIDQDPDDAEQESAQDNEPHPEGSAASVDKNGRTRAWWLGYSACSVFEEVIHALRPEDAFSSYQEVADVQYAADRYDRCRNSARRETTFADLLEKVHLLTVKCVAESQGTRDVKWGKAYKLLEELRIQYGSWEEACKMEDSLNSMEASHQ